MAHLAWENVRFSSLFAAGDVSRNVPIVATLGARDFSSAVSGFCQVFIVFLAALPLVASAYGRGCVGLRPTTKIPTAHAMHARKTSGTQGTLLHLNVTYRIGMFQFVNWKPNISRTRHLLIVVSKVMCSLIYVKVPLFSSGFREKTNARCAKMAANLNEVQNNGNSNNKKGPDVSEEKSSTKNGLQVTSWHTCFSKLKKNVPLNFQI